MTKILGIDPGSRITGWGVVDLAQARQPSYVASGCIRLKAESLGQKLAQLYAGLTDLIAVHQPDEVAIEQVFMARNADSALKLGQARGAAMVCVVNHGLAVAEYAATEIKQAVVGKGSADKTQVQHMVTALLGLSGRPQADAADALAIALCHAHTRGGLTAMSGQLSRKRGSRWRDFKPEGY